MEAANCQHTRLVTIATGCKFRPRMRWLSPTDRQASREVQMQPNTLMNHKVEGMRCLHQYRIVGMPSAEVQISYCVCQSMLPLPAM